MFSGILMMKTLALIPFFLYSVIASISTLPQVLQSRQWIFHNGHEVTEANIRRLMASCGDDPVEVIRLVDPGYVTILNEPRLLEMLGAESKPVWMTEGDKLRLQRQGYSFMDLTRHEELFRPVKARSTSIIKNTKWPSLRHQERINNVIKSLKKEVVIHNLSNLTQFYNRYYRSEHGAQSSWWMYNKVLEIIADAPHNIYLSAKAFTHEFPQISVIARFEPARGRSRSNHPTRTPIIVIASHLDSVNHESPLLAAPGADDGGSGTVTVLEAFRALVQSEFRPEIPVEFHWYAAEEGGLLGSQDVVSEYVHQRKDVMAMIQFDMTGYVRKDAAPSLTFITNNVDASLTNWTMQIATKYALTPVAEAQLFPGGVSDHLSWHRAGFPVVLATESDPTHAPNPYIHTVDDRITAKEGEFSFELVLEFTKIAIGFAVELGGWIN